MQVDQLDYTRAIRIDGRDLNTLSDAGFYCGLGLGNAPHGGFWYVEVQRFQDDASYITQRLTELAPGNGASTIYNRTGQGGTWGPLVQVYTSANPPPATGGGGSGPTAAQILRREKRFNIRDYGADENADAATNGNAIRAAGADLIQSGGGTLVLGGGYFNVDGDISIDGGSGVDVRVVGAENESTLAVVGSAAHNGLIISGKTAVAEGFSLVCGTPAIKANGGSLLFMNDAAPLGSHFQTLIARDLRMEGRGPTLQPQNFFAINNPAFARLNNIGIVAFDNVSFGDKGNIGVYIFGTPAADGSAVGDFSVHGVNVYGVENAFRVIGGTGANGQQTVEGCSFTDCVVQGARYGLWMSASGYQAPGHSWKGGHINCDGGAIKLESWAQFKVSDALFYIDASSARKEGHFRLTNCTEIVGHHNHCFHFGELGPDNGAGISGVGMDGNTSLCRFDDNDFIGFAAGSAAIYNAGSGGGNRASGNGKSGGGVLLAGNVQDRRLS